MTGTIRTFNFRTGEHKYRVGDTWAVNDGPTFLGWRTVVPMRCDGEIALRESLLSNLETAEQAAAFMEDFEGSLEEARDIVLERWPQLLKR